MHRVSFAVVLLSILSGAGCAHRHPLLCCSQSRAISAQERYLKKYRAPVLKTIQEANTTGALVLMSDALDSAPTVLPAQTALNAARVSLQDIPRRADRCTFVFHAGLGLEPESWSCVRLRIEAEEIESLAQKLREQQATIEALKAQIQEIATNLTAAMVATAFHADQVKSLEEALKVTSDAFASTTDQVGRNNKQIADVTAQVAAALSEVSKNLGELRQRVEAVK